MKKIRIVYALALFLVISLATAALAALAYGSITGTILGMPYNDITSFVDVSAEKVAGYLLIAFLALWKNGFTKFFNWLKNTARLSGRQAHMFVSVLSFMLAGIILLATNTIDLKGLNFTLSNLIVVGAQIYAFTQVAYEKYLKLKQ